MTCHYSWTNRPLPLVSFLSSSLNHPCPLCSLSPNSFTSSHLISLPLHPSSVHPVALHLFIWSPHIPSSAASPTHPSSPSLFTTTRSKQQWSVTQSALESTMGCAQSENTQQKWFANHLFYFLLFFSSGSTDFIHPIFLSSWCYVSELQLL